MNNLSTGLPTLYACGGQAVHLLCSKTDMRNYQKFIRFALMLIIPLILAPFKAESSMSSTNYQIQWDSVGAGGEDTSSSATYKVRDSFGMVQGVSTSSSYSEQIGFRAGIYDPVVSYSVFSQVRASQVAATSLSGSTVSVTSTSGYSTGDYVAVIQDEGASQVSAIGKISSVGAGSLTVDVFQDGGTAPIIDGTNDYVYELSGNSLPLSTLSSSVVTTGIVGWEVNADVSSGYSVYVLEDGDLTTGSDTITDVADGTVTAGSTEYGARSSDASLAASTFDTQDTAFTTSLQQVASRGDNSMESRDFLTVKAAVSSSQAGGSYSQNLTLVFVGNY